MYFKREMNTDSMGKNVSVQNMHYFRETYFTDVLTVQCVEIKIKLHPLDG